MYYVPSRHTFSDQCTAWHQCWYWIGIPCHVRIKHWNRWRCKLQSQGEIAITRRQQRFCKLSVLFSWKQMADAFMVWSDLALSVFDNWIPMLHFIRHSADLLVIGTILNLTLSLAIAYFRYFCLIDIQHRIELKYSDLCFGCQLRLCEYIMDQFISYELCHIRINKRRLGGYDRWHSSAEDSAMHSNILFNLFGMLRFSH